MKGKTGRRWYLTALAALYLVLCSGGCLYYLSLHFRSNPPTVPVVQQGALLNLRHRGWHVFPARENRTHRIDGSHRPHTHRDRKVRPRLQQHFISACC